MNKTIQDKIRLGLLKESGSRFTKDLTPKNTIKIHGDISRKYFSETSPWQVLRDLTVHVCETMELESYTRECIVTLIYILGGGGGELPTTPQ